MHDPMSGKWHLDKTANIFIAPIIYKPYRTLLITDYRKLFKLFFSFYDMHFITGSDLFLGATPAVCYLTHIYRIIKHTLYKAGLKTGDRVILTKLLGVSVIVKI